MRHQRHHAWSLVTRHSSPDQAGSTLTMTLIFVVMFTIIFIGLGNLVSRSYHESVLQAQDETAFQIAEAGLHYARWRLAHNIEDFTPASRVLKDQAGGDVGTYDLTFDAPPEGGTVVTITATGTTAAQPGRDVTLRARYGRPSLARFSSITNNDVWYGGTMQGAVHANGGIRMTGTSDGLMTSARETYECQPHHDCNPPFETKPGVWGTGTTQELWEFPVPPVDYNAITVDLLDMRTAAQAANTYYGPSEALGYQIVFHGNNTYTISRVTAKGPSVWSHHPETGWLYNSYDVGTTDAVETRPVPSGGLIYVEDTLWVYGDIRDRVTIAAGVFPDNPSTNVDIIINGSLTYDGVTDGSRVLGVVSQRHVMFPWSGAPDIAQLDGAYLAQKGRFHRRYYPNGSGAEAHYLKTSLTRYGMIASNAVPATAWVNGAGQITSGYQSGQATYDPNLLYSPPPYFPSSGAYEFISWEEQQ